MVSQPDEYHITELHAGSYIKQYDPPVVVKPGEVIELALERRDRGDDLAARMMAAARSIETAP